MIDGYDVEVKLLAVTGEANLPSSVGRDILGNAEDLIEHAGRLCWDTQGKTGEIPDRIQKWIGVGHETMIEHASATFYIRCSRVVTHELVRHRIASYSQRSQRYVNESEPRYIIPPELHGVYREGMEHDVPIELDYIEFMARAWDMYSRLLKAGIKPEIARYVLPNACETQIIATFNFREIRHIIKLRTSKRALPEMRAVAGEIRRIAKEIAPRVFEDL